MGKEDAIEELGRLMMTPRRPVKGDKWQLENVEGDLLMVLRGKDGTPKTYMNPEDWEAIQRRT